MNRQQYPDDICPGCGEFVVHALDCDHADCGEVQWRDHGCGPEAFYRPETHEEPCWPDTYQLWAVQEGWNLRETELWSLQGEYTPFRSDTYAWVYVWRRAAEGSHLHRRALDYIEAHNPEEYSSIRHRAEVGDIRGIVGEPEEDEDVDFVPLPLPQGAIAGGDVFFENG